MQDLHVDPSGPFRCLLDALRSPMLGSSDSSTLGVARSYRRDTPRRHPLDDNASPISLVPVGIYVTVTNCRPPGVVRFAFLQQNSPRHFGCPQRALDGVEPPVLVNSNQMRRYVWWPNLSRWWPADR